jgi:M6 family metalloprotease-like protein
MQLHIQPDGGLPAETMDVPFAALAFNQPHDLFPVQVRFDAADTLKLKVVTPTGTALTLDLKFTAKSIDIDSGNVPAKLDEIATYFDGILHAAETAAGLATRLFAKPVAHRIHASGMEFGRLAVTVNSATVVGPKLSVLSALATVSGADPLGMGSAHTGTNNATSAGDLQDYINLMLDLAREAKGFDENTRRLDTASVTFNGASKSLTTTIPVSTIVGGPTAAVSLNAASGLDDLFTANSTKPNSATTANNANAIRDADALFSDVFTVASQRLIDVGRDPKVELAGWHVAMIIPVDAAKNVPGDAESVQPFEQWNVTPLNTPFGFRGVEAYRTVSYVKDNSIQLKAVWTLDFFNGGKPDSALICHELGHGLGFRDLYFQTGYRQDLAYLGDWAIMDSHPKMPHHSGYHKLQAGWITDDRTIVIPPTDADQTTNTEVLLVPVELWDGAYPDDARTAFGTAPDMSVVQLVRLDLGGDGAVFDFIEARQKGVHFSQQLPGGTPGVLITNAIEPWDDQRYSFNGNYRRELQLLNPANILTKTGDSFDLAKAAGLSAKGIVVTIVDRKVVRDATVFRVRVTRTNTDFIDLYFANADPYYRNSDLWVDWAGDNPSKDPKDHHEYPLGQPTDQGEIIRVPDKGTELHWLVARLRNRGQVHAENVKLNFKICVPPGGGDRSGNFQLLGGTTIADMPGGDAPVSSPFGWQVPAGFGGHTCIAVEIADFKIPKDSDGAALASDDVWLANNHAQKNVDEFIPLQASPFAATEFDYGVHNDAPRPEIAYLEPDGLPYGMKLTVTPRSQVVLPKQTVIFHCKLELDDKIIAAGCRSDRQFRLVTWRRDPESTTRWGGVQYKVRPRKRCATSLAGYWSYGDDIQLTGTVTPNPGGRLVRIRLAFDVGDAFWVPLNLASNGTFIWNGRPPKSAFSLHALAVFEGNALWGPARSAPLDIQAPPPIK